jgi:hypothetical protein
VRCHGAGRATLPPVACGLGEVRRMGVGRAGWPDFAARPEGCLVSPGPAARPAQRDAEHP